MPSSSVLPPVTRIIAAFPLVAALLSGQTNPALKPGKVEGIVTNSVNGDPVKKATVTLITAGKRSSRSVVTDSAGRFHFDSVEPGTYQAMAGRDGFTDERRNRHTPADTKALVVGEEQEVKDLLLKLVPLATVSGHVFDEDGEPVARAQVQALAYVYRPGDSRQLNGAGWASTNDLGEYQLLDLVPGKYYFLAAVQPRLRNLPPHIRGGGIEQTYPDTFYPSASEATQGTASQLALGAQLSNIDFRVHKVPAYHVRGKAVDSTTGKPISNAQVRIQPRESIFFEHAEILHNGTFDARGVVSGSYILIVQTGDMSTQRAVNVGDHDVDDVVLTLRPPIEISGTVRLEGPAAEHTGRMQVGLNAETIGSNSWTPVNKDGSFTVKVMPSVYRIEAICNVGAYVKSIRLGDQEVPNAEIDLTDSSSGALNIVCGTDVGKLQGTVQSENDEPSANVMITVAPDDEHRRDRNRFYQFTSDQNGKFESSGIAPGDYKVFAWEAADMEMLLSEEFQKAFGSRGVAVSIAPGGNGSVQVKMISTADIEVEKNKLP